MRILPYTCMAGALALLGCAAVSWTPARRAPLRARYRAPLPRPVALPIALQGPLVALEPPEIEPSAIALPAPVQDGPFSADYWLPIRVESTGYCPCRRCCGRGADGVVAWHPNGRKRRTRDHPWGIAADPRILPYGTRVAVPREDGTHEYKPSRNVSDNYAWTVDDTGGDMRGAWDDGRIAIDLRFIHHRSGDRYGRHWRTVYVDVRTLTPRQIARLERFKDHYASSTMLARR